MVAEAGVNHDGSLDDAVRLVDAAVEAGADAVKFQMFRAADLVTSDAQTAGYQQEATQHRSQRNMLERLEFTPEQFRVIRDHCQQRSITFLATPFGTREIGHLLSLGAPAIKIASTDLNSDAILVEAAATGLPLILSTGASTGREIDEAVARLKRSGAANQLVLLHCVSCYPTPLKALNLRVIMALRMRYGVPCGLSDHTTSTHTGAWAIAAGADMLEKHLTLDRSRPGPDHAMSLDPVQLKEYIMSARAAEESLGDGQIGLSDCQVEVRAVAGRSVVSSVDIRAGTQVTMDMVTLKRPGTGIPPADIMRITGRRAAIDIPRDTVLSWEMMR